MSNPVQEAGELLDGKMFIMGKTLDDLTAHDIVTLLDKPALDAVALAFQMRCKSQARLLADAEIARYSVERELAELRLNHAKDRRLKL